MRGEIRALEEALGALVGAVEQAAVDPFGVEQEDERAAHPGILEHGPARVEDESGHAGRQARRELAFDDAAVLGGREAIALDPAGGVVLGPHVDLAGLEGFEQRGGVAEILDADLIEIETPARDREVARPPVGVAAIGDGAPGVDLGDDVGSAADRRLQRGALEGLGVDLVPRQDRHEREDERDLAIAGRSEGEADAAGADFLRLRHLAVVRAVIGPALLLQDGVTEEHVLGRDRGAVGKAGLGAQVEGDGAAVLGDLDAFRDQPVERERLIAAARHQALVYVVANIPGGHAPEDECIEAVEGAERPQHQPAAFGAAGLT